MSEINDSVDSLESSIKEISTDISEISITESNYSQYSEDLPDIYNRPVSDWDIEEKEESITESDESVAPKELQYTKTKCQLWKFSV